MLSKYAAIFLPISCLLYLALKPETRVLLRKKGFYLSLMTAFLLLLPNILWNEHHAFATLQAVKQNANLGGNFFHLGNLAAFLGSQFALFNPILFITLFLLICQWRRIVKDKRQRLLLIFVLPLFTVIAVEALLSRANANWAAPIYIAGTIPVCAYCVLANKTRWLVASLIFNSVVFLGFYAAPTIVRTIGIKLPLQTTTLGWPQVGRDISLLHKQYPQAKLLVNDRMLMALSMYYSNFPLEQSFKWNPFGLVRDQYDLVTHISQQKGSDFILVSYFINPREILDLVSEHKLLMTLQQPTLDGRSIKIYLFYLHNFHGYPKGARSPGERKWNSGSLITIIIECLELVADGGS